MQQLGHKNTDLDRYIYLINLLDHDDASPLMISTMFLVARGRAMKPIVAYVRVSTGQQGRSELGIEAQREALGSFWG